MRFRFPLIATFAFSIITHFIAYIIIVQFMSFEKTQLYIFVLSATLIDSLGLVLVVGWVTTVRIDNDGISTCLSMKPVFSKWADIISIRFSKSVFGVTYKIQVENVLDTVDFVIYKSDVNKFIAEVKTYQPERCKKWSLNPVN